MSPIFATLLVPQGSPALDRLYACECLRDSLRRALAGSPGQPVATHEAPEPLLQLDVLQVLVLESVDEEPSGFRPSQADVKLWATAGDVPVLTEADFLPGSWEKSAGVWNLELLRWLKAVSQACRATLRIAYEHEWGDEPCITAHWESAPSHPDGEVESFGHEWYATGFEPDGSERVVRHAGGRIEIRADGDWGPGSLPER